MTDDLYGISAAREAEGTMFEERIKDCREIRKILAYCLCTNNSPVAV